MFQTTRASTFLVRTSEAKSPSAFPRPLAPVSIKKRFGRPRRNYKILRLVRVSIKANIQSSLHAPHHRRVLVGPDAGSRSCCLSFPLSFSSLSVHPSMHSALCWCAALHTVVKLLPKQQRRVVQLNRMKDDVTRKYSLKKEFDFQF